MSRKRSQLAAGRRPVYVATRLYEPAGRYLGARLERGCLAGLIAELGEEAQRPLTFLPYRDSNAALRDVAPDGLSRAIFELDSRRLRDGYALLAPLGDLQADSGVAFEVGYAAASGVPAALFGLNFFKLRYPGSAGEWVLPPLLEALAAEVHDLGGFEVAAGRDYLEAVEAHLDQIERAAADLCRRWAASPPDPPATARPRPQRGRVHLEFAGGRNEAAVMLARRAEEVLRRRGWRVGRSRRHELAGDPLRLALDDLKQAASSQVVVVWGDGDDVDAESAALQGYVYGLGRRVILYGSERRRVYAGPGYDNRFNLMLSCSAEKIVSSLDGLAAALG